MRYLSLIYCEDSAEYKGCNTEAIFSDVDITT